MDKTAQIEKRIAFAEGEIKVFQQILEDSRKELEVLKQEESRDPLIITDSEDRDDISLLIESNYESWRYIKNNINSISQPFYLSVYEDKVENCIGLSIADAKLLRNYLTQKIDYLES